MSGERSVLKSAGAMGVGTLFSRLLGLIREQVFAYLFGAGNATDAFNIAFRIPNLLRDLFAEGAMSASLVPTFTKVRSQEGDRRAWRVAGRVFRVLFVLVSALAVAGIVFAPELVSLYAGAFKKIPGKFELTVLMTRTMFPFFPLVALAAAFVGILNACGMFFLPAFSSAIFNLVSIVTGVFFAFLLPRFGIQPIAGMAIGVVLGGFAQAFCQLPSLYRKGYRWESFQPGEVSWYQDPALRRMLVLMIPGTVGLAATQVNIFVNSLLATSQGAGAVSWLNYAFRLMQFPIGILGVSLAAATLPRVSKLWVEGDFAGVEATLGRSLKHVFAANLPAAAGLAALGCPIIRLIFEYGHFQETDTKRTAAALAAYAVGLAAYSVVKVLVPAFYGMGNTKVPVASSIFSVVLTVILNFIMIGPFGYVGLALGTSIAAIVNAVILVIAARVVLVKQGGDFALKSVGISFFRQLVLSVAMGAACYWSYLFLDGVFPDVALWSWLGRAGVVLARIFKMGILVTEGVFVVWGLARLLRVEETLEIFNLFASKLKNKLSVVKK